MNSRIHELGIGDIIRQRRSAEFYKVTHIQDRYHNGLVFFVELEHVHTGKSMARTMTQITNNWRMVKVANP